MTESPSIEVGQPGEQSREAGLGEGGLPHAGSTPGKYVGTPHADDLAQPRARRALLGVAEAVGVRSQRPPRSPCSSPAARRRSATRRAGCPAGVAPVLGLLGSAARASWNRSTARSIEHLGSAPAPARQLLGGRRRRRRPTASRARHLPRTLPARAAPGLLDEVVLGELAQVPRAVGRASRRAGRPARSRSTGPRPTAAR